MLHPTLNNAQYRMKNELETTEKCQLRVQYVFSLRLGQLQPEDLLFYSCECVKCRCAQDFPGANLGFCQCVEMALEGKIYWKAWQRSRLCDEQPLHNRPSLCWLHRHGDASISDQATGSEHPLSRPRTGSKTGRDDFPFKESPLPGR